MPTISLENNQQCDHQFILEGQVSSATAGSLTDLKKNWPINIWAGKILTLIDGLGAGQSVRVASNTANKIFLASNWLTIPNITSTYRGIVSWNSSYCTKCNGQDQYAGIGFAGGRVKTLTGIFKFAQSVNTTITTPLGGSIFNPEIGSGAELVLSADVVDDSEVEMFLRDNCEKSLNTLQNMQQAQLSVLSFDNSELLGQLNGLIINRDPAKVTALDMELDVSTQSGQSTLVSAPLNQR